MPVTGYLLEGPSDVAPYSKNLLDAPDYSVTPH